MVISDKSSPPPPPSPSRASRGVIAAVAPKGASDTIIQMILILMANGETKCTCGIRRFCTLACMLEKAVKTFKGRRESATLY